MLELLLLYFAVPTVIYFGRFRLHALVMLWIVTAYCVWFLRVQGRLELAALDVRGFEDQLPSILSLYLPFVLISTVFVYRFSRQNFFGLPRHHPGSWGLITLVYPILSVYPQGIIFRAFFFHRYRDLFPGRWILILVSALAFAYMHIVFRNWLALLLTACGGILFAARYDQTHSLLISCVEHALYGCWIFTVGLERSFFYRGRPREAAFS